MSDLRTKRTRAAIKRAFMTLRAKKTLEKITVKELSELAEINKATFYLHYQDIYDLSDKIEDELLEEAFCPLHPGNADLLDPRPFIRKVADCHDPHREAIETVFSDSRAAILPDKIEALVKKYYYAENPSMADCLYVDVLLSYMIQGSYRAFTKHEEHDRMEVLTMVMDISRTVAELAERYQSMAAQEKNEEQ